MRACRSGQMNIVQVKRARFRAVCFSSCAGSIPAARIHITRQVLLSKRYLKRLRKAGHEWSKAERLDLPSAVYLKNRII